VVGETDPVVNPCTFAWSDGNFVFSYSPGEVLVLNSSKAARFESLKSLWSFDGSLIEVESTLNVRLFDFSGRLVPKGSIFCAALIDIVGQPDCEDRFKSLLETDFSIGELAQGLACVDDAHQPLFLSLLSDQLLVSLCQNGFDFTRAFSELKPSVQSRILRRLIPSSFDSLTDFHRQLLEWKEDRFKVFVLRKCIEENDFVRAMRFARAANCDFCELLGAKTELTATSLLDCLRIINDNCAQWGGGRATPEALGCAFRSAGLANWALACFIALRDEDHAGGVLAEWPLALFAAMQYTREIQDDVAHFLRSLDLGL
jgi:hypothetical protein